VRAGARCWSAKTEQEAGARGWSKKLEQKAGTLRSWRKQLEQEAGAKAGEINKSYDPKQEV